MMFFTEKVFMNGNQSVLNRFSASGLKPLYTFGTEKNKKFKDLQIIYRVYRR